MDRYVILFLLVLSTVSVLNVVICDEGRPAPNLPDEFDAREAWPHCETIKVIQDRGECLSTFAIAVASVISDRVSWKLSKTPEHFYTFSWKLGMHPH